MILSRDGLLLWSALVIFHDLYHSFKLGEAFHPSQRRIR